MKAIGHRVHLKKLKIAEKAKEGSIIIAYGDSEKAQERAQQYGVIVDIGPDVWKGYRFYQDGKPVNGTPWAQVGDLVFIQRYAGHHANDLDTGDEYLVVNDNDILCVAKEKGTFDPNDLPELVMTKDGVMFNE